MTSNDGHVSRGGEIALEPFGAYLARATVLGLWALPVMIFVVGAIDLVLTVHALESGWLDELNPVTNFVIRSSGAAGLVAFRLTSSTAGALLLFWALKNYVYDSATARASRRVDLVVRSGVTVLVSSHIGLLVWWMITLSA
jgi:hypothetical protein